jgi:hypothetical protein
VAVTERLRDCAPLLHDLVHVDQAEKAEVAQWMAHACTLQTRVCVRSHALPPLYSYSMTERERTWPPPPHDLVQVDHAVHAVSTQSTGHEALLQVRISWSCGQATPPKVACVRARVRDW